MEEYLKAQLEANLSSKQIDWKKRKYELSKSIIQGIMASNECGIAHSPSAASEWAISIANEMIKQLKQEEL